ncbi:MAG: hypothetical protein HKO66_08585 [Saprospiraceae bacterium]|nr:hypothetical protein [Bacteroidia bacterium]NNE15417.1 hypothetical protein [Saprospiraceae bacterium]NNL92273.1 hypothetical protein [Saprospiraceae bacterium]
MDTISTQLSKAQISRAAIQRLYIAMRHLFIRGSYKPLGVSGEAMIKSLLALEPEIYGTISNTEKVELNGLLYIFQRLPQGIEECSFIKLISREGFEKSSHKAIIPAKRRRNCYRIDDDQFYVEMTRGRSDIYDVLTHLTFMYIESEKIRRNALDHKLRKKKDWLMLEELMVKINNQEEFNIDLAYTYLSTLIGRTYEETVAAAKKFDYADKVNSLFNIVYWLGLNSIKEFVDDSDREISFSSTLRDKIGHHIFGTNWAYNIKETLDKNGLIEKPIHVISANLHSVMNSIYARTALKADHSTIEEIAEKLSAEKNTKDRDTVTKYALKNGMIPIVDKTGVNIGCQVFDCSKLNNTDIPNELKSLAKVCKKSNIVLLVMDYAFGEQAYELMDELLKPYDKNNNRINLDIQSVNIMGKAGILKGNKGDIMVPDAHIFEGSADNYPFINEFDFSIFEGSGLKVYNGPMITVMGTSLQNKDILRYFANSSWKAIGLEMEGAHYQKAIQAASKIRKSVNKSVKTRYAYYASDNPLKTGSTLASGGLGVGGVKPTYLITISILNSIFEDITS